MTEFEIYERIGIGRGPVVLEPIFRWLDEINELVKQEEPSYYLNEFLGSPDNNVAIVETCYSRGMSPQEALDWWRNFYTPVG